MYKFNKFLILAMHDVPVLPGPAVGDNHDCPILVWGNSIIHCVFAAGTYEGSSIHRPAANTSDVLYDSLFLFKSSIHLYITEWGACRDIGIFIPAIMVHAVWFNKV